MQWLPVVPRAKPKVLLLANKTPRGIEPYENSGLIFSPFPSPASLLLSLKNGKHSSFSGRLHFFSPFCPCHPYTRYDHSSLPPFGFVLKCHLIKGGFSEYSSYNSEPAPLSVPLLSISFLPHIYHRLAYLFYLFMNCVSPLPCKGPK